MFDRRYSEKLAKRVGVRTEVVEGLLFRLYDEQEIGNCCRDLDRQKGRDQP